MLEFNEVQRRLRSANISEVHRCTGVSRPTLIKMKDPEVKSVQYLIYKAVSDYFNRQDLIEQEEK